jgi:putative transcriptional regulator
MSKTTTTARIRPDGTVVEMLEDGTERPFAKTPMPPMTEAEVHAAAIADPDAQPMGSERRARARRVARVKTLRRVLGLTREEFAERYHIPLHTVCDWEEARAEPDEMARAYLHVIASNPEGVWRALQEGPQSR